MNTLATRICLIWSALLLTGCIYQSVNSYDMMHAIPICKSYGEEVVEISSYFDGQERVTCSNLKTYQIHPANLTRRDTKNSYGNT